MATCLYSKWILDSTACEYYGACQRTSSYWGCYEAGALLATVLGDTPSVILGYEKHLHGPCYCGNEQHANDPACQDTVTDLVQTVLPTLANWVSSQTENMCTAGVTELCTSYLVMLICLFVFFSNLLNT